MICVAGGDAGKGASSNLDIQTSARLSPLNLTDTPL